MALRGLTEKDHETVRRVVREHDADSRHITAPQKRGAVNTRETALFNTILRGVIAADVEIGSSTFQLVELEAITGRGRIPTAPLTVQNTGRKAHREDEGALVMYNRKWGEWVDITPEIGMKFAIGVMVEGASPATTGFGGQRLPSGNGRAVIVGWSFNDFLANEGEWVPDADEENAVEVRNAYQDVPLQVDKWVLIIHKSHLYNSQNFPDPVEFEDAVEAFEALEEPHFDGEVGTLYSYFQSISEPPLAFYIEPSDYLRAIANYNDDETQMLFHVDGTLRWDSFNQFHNDGGIVLPDAELPWNEGGGADTIKTFGFKLTDDLSLNGTTVPAILINTFGGQIGAPITLHDELGMFQGLADQRGICTKRSSVDGGGDTGRFEILKLNTFVPLGILETTETDDTNISAQVIQGFPSALGTIIPDPGKTLIRDYGDLIFGNAAVKEGRRFVCQLVDVNHNGAGIAAYQPLVEVYQGFEVVFGITTSTGVGATESTQNRIKAGIIWVNEYELDLIGPTNILGEAVGGFAKPWILWDPGDEEDPQEGKMVVGVKFNPIMPPVCVYYSCKFSPLHSGT